MSQQPRSTRTVWYANAILMGIAALLWMETKRAIPFSWPRAGGLLLIAVLTAFITWSGKPRA